MTSSVPSSPETIAVRTSIRELMCGLRKDLYSTFFVTMLKAFVDDSGSGGDSSWFVLAGYVASVGQWDAFDEPWLRVLHAHPHIEYFKSSEAESLKGQFLGFTVDERDAKIDALLDVIEAYADWPICAHTRQSNYDELIKGKIPLKWDSPYYFLFQGLIGSAVTIERFYGESQPMEFVFDSNERFEKLSGRLVKSFYNLEFFQGVVNVSYRDDKKFLPLQAADLFAWQTRRFLCANEPLRQHYTRARNAGRRPPHSHIMGRQEIRRFIDDMRTQGRLLGKPEDMRTW